MYKELLKMPLHGKITLASNFLNLLLNRQDKRSPTYLSWVMSYNCNCHCLHCNFHKKKIKGELTREEKLDLAKQLAETKAYGITLSGGEPLLIPEIFDIIKILKKSNKIINLCTNGVLLRKYADELIGSKIDSITISFDSHMPDLHNKERNRKNTFNEVLDGVEYILDNRKKKRPLIKIKGLILKQNIYNLDEYINFFRKYSDQISFQPVQDNYIHQVLNRNVLFGKEEEMSFRIKFKELMKKYKFMNNDYYRYMPDFLFNDTEDFRNKIKFKCLFRSYFSPFIDPCGNVKPCYGENAGSIRENTLLEIWRSRKMREIQEVMKKSKCACWLYDNLFNLKVNKFYNFFRKS